MKYTGARVRLKFQAPPPPVSQREGDLVRERFRAISATTVRDVMIGWGLFHVDLSAEGVLKAAVPLLEGITLYKDHNTSVDNWVGRVEAAEWDAEGMPPGINVDVAIDAVADPKAARGVASRAIHAVSLGFDFNARPSHPEMEEMDFLQLQGKEVEGEIVRLVVSEITGVHELSLVWAGADPHALILGRCALSRPSGGETVTLSELAEKLGLDADASEDEIDARLAELQDEEDEEMEDEEEEEEEEGSASAAKASIEELRKAFPGRADFCLDQLQKGATLLEAKGALADILLAQSDADRAEIARLKKRQQAGVRFRAPAKKTTRADLEVMEPDARAKWEFEHQLPDVVGEFKDQKRRAAYLRAEARGLIKINSVQQGG